MCLLHFQPAPDPPSVLTLFRNGKDTILVSWTAPSGGAAVTGYMIYYQEDGGERLSVSAGASATTASITGLTVGATYSITMVATSSTLPSTVTGPQTVTIGSYTIYAIHCIIVCYVIFCTCVQLQYK